MITVAISLVKPKTPLANASVIAGIFPAAILRPTFRNYSKNQAIDLMVSYLSS